MGLFDSMKRIIMGQPVFGNPKIQNPPTQNEQVQNSGQKILPQVMVEKILCTHDSGPGLQVELYVRNYSKEGVELERLEFLDIRYEIGKHINVGESYEYLVDLPSRPHDTVKHECRIYFRTDAGDYFWSLHLVEFDALGDGTYTIRRIRFLPPIKDV